MAPSSGKKKQQLKVAGLSQLLQASPSDTIAAATVACRVAAAVEELVPGQQGRTSSKSGPVAGLPYVGVLLHAAGWLARARFQHKHPSELQTSLYVAVTQALRVSATLLQQRDKVTLDQLRPALRPCPEDGVTPEAVFALNLVAKALVEDVPKEGSDWAGTARAVARAWCFFNEACFQYKSNKARAALHLTGPILQLLAAMPQHIRNPKPGHELAIRLLGGCVTTLDMALMASAHPGLRRWLPNSSSNGLSPEQLEVCDVNIRVALQQQDLWWRSLAVQVTFLAEVTAAGQVPPRPLEPERFCPDYGAGYAWPPECWTQDKSFALKVSNRVLGVLVVAEVWWLWPWQLQVLEAGAAKAAAVVAAAWNGQQIMCCIDTAPPTAAAEAPGPGSSRPDAAGKVVHNAGSRGDGGGDTHHGSPVADSSSIHSTEGSSDSSSRGGAQSSMAAQCKDLWQSEERRYSSCIPYPLTPALVAPGCVPPPQCPLPPVTRQQLQLALALVVNTGGETFTTAALLLMLLLQRADPGLRAAFLNGPEASLLLVSLVTWGCHPGEWGVHEVPTALGICGQDPTWEGAVQLMLRVLQNSDVMVGRRQHSASAALVLALCYLEPAAPRHVDGQQQQEQLVVMPFGPSALNAGTDDVAVVPVPACDLRLARGVVPTPQLVGTLEALARVVDPLSLSSVEAVVSACCRALMQPSNAAGGSHGGSGSSADSSSGRGNSSHCTSGRSSGRGGGDGNDAGGGSDSSSSSSSSMGDNLRSGVMQGLASMAVMLAATVDSMPESTGRASPVLLSRSRLTSSAAIAAHLLRLAAHEVAAGRAGRATLALATAAQQLSCACANEAPVVLERLEDSAELTAGQVFDGQSSSAELVVHTSNIAFVLQGLLDALAALRAAVEGWQQRGASGVHGPLPGSVCGVPPEAACAAQQQQQQQQQEQEEQLEKQQFDRYLQAKQEVEQEQQQLKHRQRQEQQDLQQATLRVQKELEQQKQLLEQQQESGQSASAQQSQQQYVELLQGQLVELEQKQVQQQKTHADQHLEQQRSALFSYNSAVEDLIEDVSCVSNISLRLAGCNWVGCTQQHKGMYSSDAAVAGLRGARCGGCGLVRYCCPQHQQADWKRHGRVCRRLAQARAGAGYAGGRGAAGTS